MSWASELYDGPIVSGPATPFRFPSVTHIRRSSGHDQVMPVTKEHVAARKHERAVFRGCEIDVARTLSRSQSGTTSPYTRNRATPPSGKILKRRCVIRSPYS